MEDYALIARQEKQIEALKTENDYLKKVKTPTQIENAYLQQRNDALELENNSLKSEIQVINEKYETVKLSTESTQSEKLELTQQHNRKKQLILLITACVFVPVVVSASILGYRFGHREGHRNGLSDARNAPQFRVGQVLHYLVVYYKSDAYHKSGGVIHPTTVSENTGVRYDNVLSILLTLEKRGILTKSHDSPPTFYLKE